MKKYVCNSPNEGGKSVLYNTFNSLCICFFYHFSYIIT